LYLEVKRKGRAKAEKVEKAKTGTTKEGETQREK
jgi:hypothetical protein